MNELSHRERFLRVFNFKDVDRVPDYEFGFWGDTIKRWHKEGLPPSLTTMVEVELYLNLEGFDCLEMIPVNMSLSPLPRYRIVEYKPGGRIVIKDDIGGVYVSPIETSCVAGTLRYPLASKEDWEKHFKPRLNPNDPRRFPPNPKSKDEKDRILAEAYLLLEDLLPGVFPSKTILWKDLVESYKERDYPLGIFVGSLYGWLRNWMGVRQISIAFYRDPDWVAEMMDCLTELWVRVLQKVLRDVKPDFTLWWEDMASNTGPLISPSLFEEFMVPRYKRVIKLLEDHGVKIHIVDSDGNIAQLIPGWLKAGINCMMPVEARANDAVKLREEFGKKLLLLGCIDKLAVMKGERHIEMEFKRLTPLLEEGGFIPMIDHRCPPEISYRDYLKYLRLKRKWISRS